MENGAVVNIMEVIPLNFNEKSNAIKDNTADIFGMSFKQFPKSGQIKIMQMDTDLEPFIMRIRKATALETDKRIIERAEDYIKHTVQMQKKHALTKRFFFIYEYEGDEKGKKSDKFDDIYEDVMMNQYLIAKAFHNMGNLVITMENDSIALAEILYRYLNPQSSKTEDFAERVRHVSQAAEYCMEKGIGNKPSVVDYIAPRGTRFGRNGLDWNYVVQDGVYQTYLVLKDNSYPTYTYINWLDDFNRNLKNGDIDIFYRQSESQYNTFILDRVNVISTGVSTMTSANKGEEMLDKSANAKYLKDMIEKQDEDLYNVCIIITIRASSFKQLMAEKKAFLKNMKTLHYYFEDCSVRTQLFYSSTLPLNQIDDTIFNSNKRNMTNSALSTLYCFTTLNVFDNNGIVFGMTMRGDSTLYAIDIFNYHIYANPHIFIAGQSGSGKSFTERMIASRMRMTGARCLFLLPLKGHEYRDTIHSMGGCYAKLGPGSKDIINICEIRPEKAVDYSLLSADEIEDLENQPSLLAKKVTSLITWVRILMNQDKVTVDELSEMNDCFTNVYRKFGITEDNNSIWADPEKTTLKLMPIIQDLYEAALKIPKLGRVVSVLKPWVSGNCQNMNAQTNIDVDNMTIGFDINEDLIGEDLLPGFMYICFDLGYDICKQDLNEPCLFILDEAWKMLVDPQCGKNIFKMIKILRAYNASVITATQDINDCLNNQYGEALLTNSAIKIFMKMEEQGVKAISKAVTLTEENKTVLQTMGSGKGYIFANNDRVLVDFAISTMEAAIYETKPHKKREHWDAYFKQVPDSVFKEHSLAKGK